MLALVSGDVDPFHSRANGAARARPDARTTEAAGAEALIAAALGTRLPGPGMTILRQDLHFHGDDRRRRQADGDRDGPEKHREASEVVLRLPLRQPGGARRWSRGRSPWPPRPGTSPTPRSPRRSWSCAAATPLPRSSRPARDLPPVACAVVHPCDRDSLLGPVQAARRGLIEPVLVGPEEKIREVAQAEGVDLGPYRIVPMPHSHAAAAKAVELARAGEVEALMKGSLHTDELMAAVVPSATGLRTGRRISHVFVMDVPSYPRMLLITDAADQHRPRPGGEGRYRPERHRPGPRARASTEPKVAILSAVETVNPKMPSTLEAAALCKMADRGQITGGVLDGPLAFDNAISLEAARTKKIASPVAGQADILLVPDLEAGNMLAKQLIYLAGAEAAGIVLGTRVPIVLTSRADSVRTRLASTAVMALVAHARRAGQVPDR